MSHSKQATEAVPYEGQGSNYLAVANKAAIRVAESLRGRLQAESTMTKKLTTGQPAAADPLENDSLASLSSGRNRGQSLKTLRIVAHLPSERWGNILLSIQNCGCSLVHLESQQSVRQNGCPTDLVIDARLPTDAMAADAAMEQLRKLGPNIRVFEEKKRAAYEAAKFSIGEVATKDDSAVWFPRRMSDLDAVVSRVLQVEEESIDHPSTQDEQYRTRRKMFAKMAIDYRHDQPIPLVNYTDVENRTWSVVFNRLCDLYDKHACKEFLENFKLLRETGLYRSDRIPQLRDVSDFVKRRSGFTLRPVAGYLSARDFLSALALRVFCCTQYIRHSERPFYTPEPDCCHELLGHVPMLGDPAFAHFSQEIGLASLGASDEDVKKLATCYFFTVEFGFCKEAGKLKVYGAGLLACVDEFQHAVSDCATIREFEPALVLQQECKVTSFQDMYFYTNSFAEAKDKLRHFASTLRRNHTLLYNPYTQSVEIVMDASSEAVKRLIDRICWDLQLAAQVAEDFNI